MKFREGTRVKIPILHLVRLGYQYLSPKGQIWDLDGNIFPNLFNAAILKINPGIEPVVSRLLEDTKLELDNEDLGRAFFERLTDRSDTRLINFENFNNNFHVVTELTCQNNDEEFRPDGDSEPVRGAFYASSSYQKPAFNHFNEEEVLNLTALLKPLSEEEELKVLEDNNLEIVRSNPEFQTNKQPESPTNRIGTSLVSRESLAFNLAPPRDRTIIENFAIAGPVFETIEMATKENQRFSALREWILPMLMNGQAAVE